MNPLKGAVKSASADGVPPGEGPVLFVSARCRSMPLLSLLAALLHASALRCTGSRLLAMRPPRCRAYRFQPHLFFSPLSCPVFCVRHCAAKSYEYYINIVPTQYEKLSGRVCFVHPLLPVACWSCLTFASVLLRVIADHTCCCVWLRPCCVLILRLGCSIANRRSSHRIAMRSRLCRLMPYLAALLCSLRFPRCTTRTSTWPTATTSSAATGYPVRGIVGFPLLCWHVSCLSLTSCLALRCFVPARLHSLVRRLLRVYAPVELYSVESQCDERCR
jgi:hypothetical protein